FMAPELVVVTALPRGRDKPMVELLKDMISAPAANVLIIIGAAFLFIAIVGNVAGKIEPGKLGRVLAAVAGIPLILVGILVQLPRNSTSASTQNQSGAPSTTEVPAPPKEADATSHSGQPPNRSPTQAGGKSSSKTGTETKTPSGSSLAST